MDQLKTQLAVVLKYGFWITSALVLFGSLGVWFMTTSKLAEESAKQTSRITGAIGTVKSVNDELDQLPNDHSHAEMERLISDRQDEVLKSWEMLYDRQRDILTWPVNELKQDFVDEFKPLIPIEIAVNFPTDPFDEKETTLLSRYEVYIKNVLPDIAKIARTEWTAEFNASAGMGGMGGMDMGEMDMGDYGAMPMMSRTNVDITGAQQGPLVEWDTGSQTQVLKDLFPWRGRQPTTLEVLYSQENIWILKQLLQIIDDVNGEARQPYQAKIHQIKRIGIGRSVRFGAGSISKPGAAAIGGMGGMDMEMEMDMDSMGGMDMDMDMESMGGGVGFGTGATSDPGDNRYVNASFEPITGATLRSALTSNSPNDAALAVAKRIPVMMSLNMDQRAVHELLAVCGSAPLMVEVQQVRVLPKNKSAGGGMMGGGMDEMEGMDDMMGGGMGMGMGGMGMGGGGGAPGMETVDEFPLDMSVEIYGIIYIYNKPDPAKFGVELVTEDTVIDGATETIGGTPVAPAAAVEGELPTPTTPAPATPDPATPAPATPANPAPAPDPNAAAPPVTTAPVSGPPTAILPLQP